MIRLLILFGSLALLVAIPCLSFADDFQKAQRGLLEFSNLEAWKLLEADPGNKLPASAYDFGPISSDENAADVAFDQPDDYNSSEIVPPQIPEPATAILLGLGLIGLGVRRRRKN